MEYLLYGFFHDPFQINWWTSHFIEFRAISIQLTLVPYIFPCYLDVVRPFSLSGNGMENDHGDWWVFFLFSSLLSFEKNVFMND